uniref:hypothetical protein n=1 Tax=Parolsenella massiliensis TaxID=1871022 RepID=UPI00093250BD|nr:hypothetical protein [Parolsenella massiliensis]
MGANELSEHVDVMISEETAPVDAAEVLRAAMGEGCRCVHVASSLAPAARTAAQGRCHVAVSCSQVLGWPDNSLLMHAGLMLSETGADELDIPVEHSLLGDEAWLAGQLRRVTQLCHAHGALANVVVDASGMAEKDVRQTVRAVMRTSVNALVLVDASAIQLAAAVGEARGNLPIQVFNPNEDPTRLLSLGASTIRIPAMSFNGEKLAA